ncbi:hypothetical protein BDV95DRAFT_589037 [Massariosphaeria phaeospora]|uniref:F-box domain-containing protein n=1 Tax=Massariosphaeria phaeospora TaxID=100035 RepID=A0A7C8MGZ9_9PLEO|nr:hypothetical protein BDV95DRAFT_589037 [Massariosphaeria phaeospora]
MALALGFDLIRKISTYLVAAPDASQQSPLLRLPGELRNQIYELALSDDEVLVQEEASGLFRLLRNMSPRKELNQLKYTCRQLRHETRGLVPALNTLRFPDSGIEEQSVVAGRFLTACPQSTQTSIQKIVIEEHTTSLRARPLYWKGVAPLCEFCREHPNMTIELSIDCAGSSPEMVRFIAMGNIISAALRKKPMDLQMVLVTAPLMGSLKSVWAGYAEDAEPVAENLRVIPRGTFTAHATQFRPPRTPQGRLWLAQIEKWHKEGI